MKKQNILFGLIGLLAGLSLGYLGADYLNRQGAPGPGEMAAAADSELPPDHPPSGGGEVTGPAMDAIQQARSAPNDFELQMKAASLFKQIGRNEGAIEFYERARQAKPNDFDLLVALGNTNFDLKRYSEAEKWYRLALEVRPNDPLIRMDLGSTFYLREPRDLDQAILHYRSALKADPRHEKTLQNLARALIDKGEKAAAGQILARLEEVNPDNPSIQKFRAEIK
ncbi:MAG: tetratricopeptide repeat protein [Blastocatellia bacterium]